jgi:hypothetical protein
VHVSSPQLIYLLTLHVFVFHCTWPDVCAFRSSYDITEAAAVIVTLYSCIREVLSSNLVRDTGYPEIFRGLPQSLQADAGAEPRLGHNSSFIDHPIIRRHTVGVLTTATARAGVSDEGRQNRKSMGVHRVSGYGASPFKLLGMRESIHEEDETGRRSICSSETAHGRTTTARRIRHVSSTFPLETIQS